MRPSRYVLLMVTAALLLAACLPAAAQEKKKEKEPPPQPFSVSLNVTVRDAPDRPVGDLKREDFQVVEDGVPQTVTSVERLEGPLAFGLVVDNSGSLRSTINKVIGLANLIVQESSADSSAFVVRFVSSDQIQLLRDFTTNKRALEAALEEMYVEGGQTAVNDALYAAAEYLEKSKSAQASPRRYALVLITDGEDRASHYKTETVLEKLRAVGAPVFIVGFPDGVEKQTPASVRRYMEWLAAGSGGDAFFYEKKADPEALARQVLGAMGADYRVTYTPANQKRDRAFRSVKVGVSAGAGGEARKALTKEGYFAPGEVTRRKGN